MYKTKTNIVMERFLLKNAIKLEEERQVSDYFYSKYHARLASDYYNILCDLEDFVGYDSSKQDENSNDFTTFISKATFGSEKPEEAFRKKYGNASYLRALGEAASYYFKNKINDVIEEKILPDQPTNPALESLYYDGIYAYDQPFNCNILPVVDLINNRQLEFSITKKLSKYEISLVKPVEQLEFEQVYLLKAFKKLVDEAKDDDTKKTYRRYARYASYIDEYYISISSGKYLITPKLSDSNIETIKKSTKYTKEQQLREISKDNKILFDYFKGIQKERNNSLDEGKKYKL